MKNIKRDVKSQLLSKYNKENTQIITLSNELLESENIIFYPQDFEVEINGKMYDIISKSKSQYGISMLCFPDEKENEFKSELYSQLFSLFAHNPLQKNQTKAVFNFLKQLFFEPISNRFSFLSYQNTNSLKYSYFFDFSNFIRIQNSPPPEFI